MSDDIFTDFCPVQPIAAGAVAIAATVAQPVIDLMSHLDIINRKVYELRQLTSNLNSEAIINIIQEIQAELGNCCSCAELIKSPKVSEPVSVAEPDFRDDYDSLLDHIAARRKALHQS
jgi:hypothetical protein